MPLIPDDEIKQKFISKDSDFLRYKALFEYFANGFNHYLSPGKALVFYPGEGSCHGRHVDALEGFSRFFSFAASWISSYGDCHDLLETLHQGIVAGTDQNNPEYWGDITHNDQRIVEAADIALGLWISRGVLWKNFSTQEKSQINHWLEQVIGKRVHSNNWLLFPAIIQKCLEALNDCDRLPSPTYQLYKDKYYLGNGWFDDPPTGVSYYTAWATHYSLFWLEQIDPTFDPIFIRESLSKFLSSYKYFFSKNGIPIWGRSMCYRMAAPAPMVGGALLLPDEISPGLAFRALDLTWRYFVERDSLQQGTVTQGYCGTNTNLLDYYSGTGSCLWSLRSLVIAFYVGNLWDAPTEKLPIELGSFSVINNFGKI